MMKDEFQVLQQVFVEVWKEQVVVQGRFQSCVEVQCIQWDCEVLDWVVGYMVDYIVWQLVDVQFEVGVVLV